MGALAEFFYDLCYCITVEGFRVNSSWTGQSVLRHSPFQKTIYSFLKSYQKKKKNNNNSSLYFLSLLCIIVTGGLFITFVHELFFISFFLFRSLTFPLT